ncbi:MAG: cation:proton antiporter [Thermoplasmata archaeon]
MELIVTILILLVLARAAGEIMEHLKQSAMIGEIIVGIIVGPSVLAYVHPTLQLQALADLSIFLLVFLAGLEMKMEDIRNAVRGGGIFVGWGGFFIPFVFGWVTAIAFKLSFIAAIFIGLCISITALPVSIRILMDIGKLHSNFGKMLVASAITHDITALVILAIVLKLANSSDISEGFVESLFVLGRVLIFVILIILVDKLLTKRLRLKIHTPYRLRKILSRLKGKESLFALIILLVLLFAGIAEMLGLHFVVGTFFGSLLLSKEVIGKKEYEQVEKVASGITFGFLAPIFFVYVGLNFSLESLTNWIFILSILFISIIGKVLGGFIGGKLANMSNKEGLALGLGMNGRGIMELVVASIGLRYNLIDIEIFSALVLMAIVTTILTPIMLRRVFAEKTKWDAFKLKDGV